MTQFTCGGKPLSDTGLHDVCDAVGTTAAEIWSVIFTETDAPYGGFFTDARPQILYEQHVFSRLTKHRFDQTNSDISNPHAGNYGATGDHQYQRLAAAAKLDESAALSSASWGIGQTLGENFAECGFASPQALVTDMFASEDKQLLAAAKEMIASGCARALRLHDWKTFARIYNGAGYAKNRYDIKLESWYAKLAGHVPDLRVRAAQVYLIFLGFQPGNTDGMWGRKTANALHAYQAHAHLPQTDEADDATFAKLETEASALIAAKPPFQT